MRKNAVAAALLMLAMPASPILAMPASPILATPASPILAAPASPMQMEEPELQIHPVIHGSLVLEYGEQVVYVDPWGRGDYDGLPAATVILITDIHSDHFDMETVARLMEVGTTVIAPDVVADEWGGIDRVLENGESITVAGIGIEAVPMYNIERGPAEGRLYHDKGRGNGYIVELGGKRIYISGDTECTPEMRALEGIDIAFVCMNLPYTMTPGEAAECVKAFRPDVVYPYHHRGSDLDVFTWELRDTGIEVRVEDWYPQSRD